MKNVIIGCLFLSFSFFSCTKDDKKSCGEARPDYTVLTFAGSSAYPDLPENVLINGAWGRIRYYITDGNNQTTSQYQLENDELKINGIVQNEWYNPTGFQVGMNTVTFTTDCNLPNAKNKFVCDCPSGISPVTKQIEVVDTVRLWIKKIELESNTKKGMT